MHLSMQPIGLETDSYRVAGIGCRVSSLEVSGRGCQVPSVRSQVPGLRSQAQVSGLKSRHSRSP